MFFLPYLLASSDGSSAGDIVPTPGGDLIRGIGGALVRGAIDGAIDLITNVVDAGAELAQAAAELVQIRLLHSILDQLVCTVPNFYYFGMEFVDTFLKVLVELLPETPEFFKLSFFVSGLASTIPLVGAAEIEQIVEGIFGMLSILLIYKLIKMLPFVG